MCISKQPPKGQQAIREMSRGDTRPHPTSSIIVPYRPRRWGPADGRELAMDHLGGAIIIFVFKGS
jgi:hypothetical protein